MFGEEQELGFRDVKFEIPIWYLSLIFREEDYLGALQCTDILETMMKLDEITMVGMNGEQKSSKDWTKHHSMFGDQRWGEICEGN